MSNLIKINVRGTIFEIEKDVLLNIPYFKNLYDACENTDIPYVSRSPYSFDAIITYITDLKYQLPEEYIYDLDFYGIAIDEKRINKKISQLDEEIKKIGFGIKDINLYQINVGNDKDFYSNCKVCHWQSKTFVCHSCIDNYKKCNMADCENNNASGSKYCKKHIKSGRLCNIITCINQNMNGTGLCFLHS